MTDRAFRSGPYGEFGVRLPDGTVVYCTVNSESQEDASFVINTINAPVKEEP